MTNEACIELKDKDINTLKCDGSAVYIRIFIMTFHFISLKFYLSLLLEFIKADIPGKASRKNIFTLS
jgi:hypothetical protein